jgi:predicted DNA-binding transcriptional regulator AlpA
MSTPSKSFVLAEPLWDALDVARFLKVSRSWVYERTMSGELPSRRIGGLRRYEPAAIRAFARGEPVSPSGLPIKKT